ncbi:flagellar hook-associated protein FlgK, partial [Paracoccus liaowanqingii]
GLQAAAPDPVGQSAILVALAEALDGARPGQPGSGFSGSTGLASRFGLIESQVSSRRVEALADMAVRSSRHSTITASMMAEGVDSDAEMQRLLQYEQSYAANARVLVAVDEMINQILRM